MATVLSSRLSRSPNDYRPVHLVKRAAQRITLTIVWFTKVSNIVGEYRVTGIPVKYALGTPYQLHVAV
jgi:hypothetical protein